MFPASTSPWLQDASPLKTLVARATYPSQPEPNYALNLEVAEYINQKKANTPREAAMTIAHLVNHRNPHVAMLALALLDTLTQNCGYPFHLQIATKEFLNELVRRFPERPPPYPGPVMSRILELIHGWKEGICTDSRWKDDLGNIRDMHRLLTFKGYRFRDVPRRAATMAVASNLKTAEELENEDREAQSAKLQELIRRGTPRDLAQAQELMKSLAGANPDAKPDYRSQALTELNKLESKVILLNEMLDNVDMQRGERFAQGDVYDQVASILKNARPKIQSWISNAETDDPESLDTFLQINDQINTVLNRYEAFKRGDYTAAANPVPLELAGSSRPGGDLSLIDFDDSDATATAAGGQPASTGGIDELASLFGPSPANAAPPQQPIQQPIQQQHTAQSVNANLFAHLNSSNFSTPVSTPPANVWSPQPHTQASGVGSSGSVRPSYGQQGSYSNPPLMAGLAPSNTPPPGQGALRLGSPSPAYAAAARPGSGMSVQPQAPMQAQQPWLAQQPLAQPIQTQAQPPQQPQGQTQQGKDPFADLVGLF